MNGTDEETFRPEDFTSLSRLVLEAWESAVDRDWSGPAGALEWSCLSTAEHTVDCVFSYALFLASRKQDAYPAFDLLRALPGATAADMVDGLRAVTNMLAATIAAAGPDVRAVIWPGTNRGPGDFAARGGLELILHGHDVCQGLGVAFDPPPDLCRRLFDHTASWPGHAHPDLTPTDDTWADVLRRSGR